MNTDKKLRVKNIFLTILFIFLVGSVLFSFYLFNENKKLKDELSKYVGDNVVLSKEEAIKTGTELYDRVTEMFEVYNLGLPYCGVSIKDLEKVEKTKFEKELSTTDMEETENEETDETDKEEITNPDYVKNNTYYYKSRFSSVDDLRNYLVNFVDGEMIKDKLNVKEIKDISLLENVNTTGATYVIYEDSLYCKTNEKIENESRYISNFTSSISPYELKTIKIRKNKITFLVTSKYLKDDIKDFDKECKDDVDSCITMLDQNFTIEKVNGVWIVTSFNVHE